MKAVEIVILISRGGDHQSVGKDVEASIAKGGGVVPNANGDRQCVCSIRLDVGTGRVQEIIVCSATVHGGHVAAGHARKLAVVDGVSRSRIGVGVGIEDAIVSGGGVESICGEDAPAKNRG